MDQILTYPPLIQILWQNSDIGLALVDKLGSFLCVNPKFCAMVEYTETELLTKTYADITHPDDIDIDLIEHDKVSSEKKTSYILTKRYITKTDKIVWVKLHVEGIRDSAGNFMFFLSQVSNFTLEKPIDLHSKDRSSSSDKKILNWVKENYKMLAVITLWVLTSVFIFGKKYSEFEGRMHNLESEHSQEK